MLKKGQTIFWPVTLSLSSLVTALILLLMTAAIILVFAAAARLFSRWFAELNSPL
jgi:hypothetical protein